MKLNLCCRESKMQFSGPTLRSSANLYIELEHFSVYFLRQKPVYEILGLQIIFKTLQLAYGAQYFCVQITTSHEFSTLNDVFMHVHHELQCYSRWVRCLGQAGYKYRNAPTIVCYHPLLCHVRHRGVYEGHISRSTNTAKVCKRALDTVFCQRAWKMIATSTVHAR